MKLRYRNMNVKWKFSNLLQK